MQWRLGIAGRSMEGQGKAGQSNKGLCLVWSGLVKQSQAKQNIAMLWFANKLAVI